jgi:hypothetical protein
MKIYMHPILFRSKLLMYLYIQYIVLIKIKLKYYLFNK